MKKRRKNTTGFNFFRENSRHEVGFTLLEVLVTTAIIGVLFVVSSAIFINTIRSTNKANATNEAKENSALVLESLERDVHNTTGTIPPPTNTATTYTLQLTTLSGNVTWACTIPSGGNNGYITRQGIPITNRDPVNGASVSTCPNIFTVTDNTLLTVNLGFVQGQGIIGGSQDVQTLVSHNVSFSVRGF